MSVNDVFSAERLEKLKIITTRGLSPEDAALERARLDYLNNTNNKILTEEERLSKLRMGAPLPTRLKPQLQPGLIQASSQGMLDPVRLLQQVIASGRMFNRMIPDQPF